MLSTQEAADLIGVCRPTLVKYLDEGRLPCVRPASHRYVKLDDLLAFEAEIRREPRAILDSMTRDETRNGPRADGFPGPASPARCSSAYSVTPAY
jgi:excisionase family DNA binding protein